MLSHACLILYVVSYLSTFTRLACLHVHVASYHDKSCYFTSCLYVCRVLGPLHVITCLLIDMLLHAQPPCILVRLHVIACLLLVLLLHTYYIVCMHVCMLGFHVVACLLIACLSCSHHACMFALHYVCIPCLLIKHDRGWGPLCILCISFDIELHTWLLWPSCI